MMTLVLGVWPPILLLLLVLFRFVSELPANWSDDLKVKRLHSIVN